MPGAPAVVWSRRLGAHLETFRRQAGLRRVDLADRLGVSEETVRLWERGAVQPSEPHLVRLIPLLAVEAASWDPGAPAERTGDDERDLAGRLLAERRHRGLTQAAAAATLGVPQSTYSSWESRRATPSPTRAAEIAEYLGADRAAIDALLAASVPIEVDSERWPPLGQLIGARREALQLSRQTLAEMVGVSCRTISNWELGHRRPSPRHLRALATALEIPVEQLAACLARDPGVSPLGALIDRRRIELGISSSELAREIGATEATLSRWVNGHHRPRPESLRRLAHALQVSTDTLRLATR